ncbi:hypothetical protein TKK_0004008 [Trichogramma kaykai]|uniref:DNA-directed RNA polymerase III subunit RPC4 n=1 Tax=Trichogramma kaykai TaxID=54128 RepID=A0ABD2XPM5_9HYME
MSKQEETKKGRTFAPKTDVVRSKDKTTEDSPKKKSPVTLPLGRAPSDTGNSSATNENTSLLEAEKLCTAKEKEQDHDTMSDVASLLEGNQNNYIFLQFPRVIPITPHEKGNPSPLSSVGEGLFGKIEITRSGKAHLVLGENKLRMETGTTRSFRQDLIVAKIKDDKSSGTLVRMGPVQKSLVLSVDWETLLKKTDKSE